LPNFLKNYDWNGRIRRTIFGGARSYLRAFKTTSDPKKIIRLGTEYGGWALDLALARHTITPDSLVVSAGAGEDISFDIELQRLFGCHVAIVDPTPRAIAHFQQLIRAMESGGACTINQSENSFYDMSGVDLSKLHFMPFALWSEKTTLRFWEPRGNNVSYSALNIQGTGKYVEVPAITVADIMDQFGVDTLPLLKLDIEGAEAAVLEALCNSRIRPTQIGVEFDFVHRPSPSTTRTLKLIVSRLQARGYEIAHYDGARSCLFRQTLDKRDRQSVSAPSSE
jgi:FkbM family methyltransferase